VKLQDLLDELRENILGDRSDRTSGDSDILWNDATLVRYINEAQRRFAKRSFVIRDSTTTEVVNVTIAAGVTEYTLHPAIIAVISARLEDAVTDLIRVGHAALGNYQNPAATVISPASFSQASPAAPMAYMTDETIGEDDEGSISVVSMRIFPAPRAQDAGTIIKLRVTRMPLDELTVNNLSMVPEIPADHHLEMLDWAAYLALRIVDQDAGNFKRAQDFASSFEGHVQEARKQVLRKLFAPQTWGFGRGGFRWSSGGGC
jgi:hypothetical protein